MIILILQWNTHYGKGHCCLTTWRQKNKHSVFSKHFRAIVEHASIGSSKHYLVLKSATDDPLVEGGAVLVKWLLGYCLPFSAHPCHISDKAGSHQKVTWHWAFSSIPKKPAPHMFTPWQQQCQQKQKKITKKIEKFLPTTFLL